MRREWADEVVAAGGMTVFYWNKLCLKMCGVTTRGCGVRCC